MRATPHAIGTGAALAVLLGASAAAAAPPGSGRAGAALHVGATVVRPAAVRISRAGRDGASIRVVTSAAANVTASAGAVARRGADSLILPGGDRVAAGPIVVTIEY